MSGQVAAIIGAFAYLQLKHFVCDYPLQFGYQLKNKGTYGHPGGMAHAAIHALGSTPVFFILPPTLAMTVVIVVGEWLLHYHIDWTKEAIIRSTKWGFADRGYWQVFGADQLLHGLTYVGIVTLLCLS